MKILQIIYESPGSPFGFGGAGVRACEIYNRLKDRHDITLLSMKYPGAVNGEREGLQYIFAGIESRSLPLSVLAFTARAASFVRKNGKHFDLIIENFLPSTPFFTARITGTPVILQVQGVMYGHAMRKFPFYYSLPMYFTECFYPGMYERFIFVSAVTRDKVLSRIARKIDFCPVIPNGVNREYLDASLRDDPYILFFSRIDVYTKGIDLLIEAFEKISRARPELRLVLAGHEFDSHRRLLEHASDFLRDRISYAGFLTGEEKLRLLSGARCLVLPSRHESSPVSIIEAAACGKALVVSDIPELRFVPEQGFGLTFPSGSASGLMTALEMILEDEGMRMQMGGKGRAFASGLLWDEIALQFEQALLAE